MECVWNSVDVFLVYVWFVCMVSCGMCGVYVWIYVNMWLLCGECMCVNAVSMWLFCGEYVVCLWYLCVVCVIFEY